MSGSMAGFQKQYNTPIQHTLENNYQVHDYKGINLI